MVLRVASPSLGGGFIRFSNPRIGGESIKVTVCFNPSIGGVLGLASVLFMLFFLLCVRQACSACTARRTKESVVSVISARVVGASTRNK